MAERWRDEDWTDRLEQCAGDDLHVPLRIPGDCELLAFEIRWGSRNEG